MLILYAIVHKPSGYFLPQPKRGKWSRAFTWADPASTEEATPRLFRSRKAAECALTWWLGGQVSPSFSNDRDIKKFERTPDPERLAAEMEIVSFSLTPVTG